jgi:hypothetical protein
MLRKWAAAPLADVVEMAKKSSEAFTRARELNPDNEHACISEVQMLARVLDYAGRENKQLGYLVTPVQTRSYVIAFKELRIFSNVSDKPEKARERTPSRRTAREKLEGLLFRRSRPDRAESTGPGFRNSIPVLDLLCERRTEEDGRPLHRATRSEKGVLRAASPCA